MPRANTNHTSIPSRKNMPRNINPRVSRVNADNDTISNLSHLVGLELQYLEETFEAAKLAMDRVLLQMKEARAKFDDLIIIQRGGGGGGEGTDTDGLLLLHQLQELKIKVSNMKSKIPFNLILPSKSEQLTSNPHFNWIPRNPQHRPRLEAPPIPTHRIPRFKHYQKIRAEDELILCCLVVFPENAIIKKSLLHGFLKACEFQSLNYAEDPLKRWEKHGLIKPVYKKCNLIVAGYWIHPLARSLLRDKLFVHSNPIPILFSKEPTVHPDSYIYVADNIEEDTIYSDPIQFRHPKGLRVLHLGIWKKSSTCHIEVEGPDILANNVSNLDRLKYLSLRGISMIKELPRCITKLRQLKTLDLKACHNIEAIPSEIANLRWSLTRLDMSECYFLVHMPMALAQLHQLEVLKGFFVGQTNKEETCTLQDLVSLRKLKKLNIYTNDRGFPDESELSALREFEALRNLTISWGGCSTSSAIHGSRRAADRPQGGSRRAADRPQGGSFSCIVTDSVDRYERFGFKLEKLDLQCIPSTIMYDWLKPGNFRTLKRLYIRGGQLHDLGQPQQDKKRKGSILAKEDQWHVEMLRLKYLNKLTVGWHDLHILFPRLIFLEKIECPNLTSLRTDDNGVWMNTTQLRERLRNRIKE